MPTRARPSIASGIRLIVLAGICFAAMDSTSKLVAMAGVPVLMLVAVRLIVQALVSTAVLAPIHGRGLMQVACPGLQLVRGALMVVSTIFAVSGLKLMPVGEFSAIVMLTPMVVTLLAGTLLKERVAPIHGLFVAGGFVGTLLIALPGGEIQLGWSVLLALGCMACSSAFQLLSSYLARFCHPANTHFCTVWVCALVGALALPLVWVPVDSAWMWCLMLVIGVVGAGGHFLLAQSFQRAPASTLMPFAYFHIGFAVLAGWLMFGHVPHPWAAAGIVLIAACGIASGWVGARQRRLAAAVPVH